VDTSDCAAFNMWNTKHQNIFLLRTVTAATTTRHSWWQRHRYQLLQRWQLQCQMQQAWKQNAAKLAQWHYVMDSHSCHTDMNASVKAVQRGRLLKVVLALSAVRPLQCWCVSFCSCSYSQTVTERLPNSASVYTAKLYAIFLSLMKSVNNNINITYFFWFCP